MSATSDYYGTREVARQLFASLQCVNEPKIYDAYTIDGYYMICSDGHPVNWLYCESDTDAIEWFNNYLKTTA